MTTPHNHKPNYGIPVAGCPRCAELKAKPYLLKYLLSGDRKTHRVPVADVHEARELFEKLHAAGDLRCATITNHGENHVVAILK